MTFSHTIRINIRHRGTSQPFSFLPSHFRRQTTRRQQKVSLQRTIWSTHKSLLALLFDWEIVIKKFNFKDSFCCWILTTTSYPEKNIIHRIFPCWKFYVDGKTFFDFFCCFLFVSQQFLHLKFQKGESLMFGYTMNVKMEEVWCLGFSPPCTIAEKIQSSKECFGKGYSVLGGGSFCLKLGNFLKFGYFVQFS